MNSELAQEIRAEMGRKQINATTLSRESGLSPSSVKRKVFAASRSIDTCELSRIGRALGVPAWELIRRAEQNHENGDHS